MKNEKYLRRKIQYIILIPIVLAIILTCVTIYLNGLDSKVGTFSLAVLVVRARPGKPTQVLEDYETPLGVEVIINHVGDCFD